MITHPYVAIWPGTDGPVVASGNGATIAHLHSAAKWIETEAERYMRDESLLAGDGPVAIEGHGDQNALLVTFDEGWPKLVVHRDELSVHDLWEAALLLEVKARHEITKALLLQERDQLSAAQRILGR